MNKYCIICILHFIVFNVPMFAFVIKTLHFNNASYISFESKFSNQFSLIMLIRILHRLRLSLITYCWSNACCRQFIISSKNSSRARIKEIIWIFKLIDVLDFDKVLNEFVWHCWKGWNKLIWFFAKNLRISQKS